MRIYLAGPMRGLPNFNLEAFDQAEKRWTEAGWEVFSPAALIRVMPYDIVTTYTEKQRRIHVIQQDLGCIYHSDAIALLPGWEASVGVTVELALAQFLELAVYDATTMEQIDPDKKPWNEIDTYHQMYLAAVERAAIRR